MSRPAFESAAAWTAAEFADDDRWRFVLDERAQRDLVAAVRSARDPGKTLFDYQRSDFDLGSAWPAIAAGDFERAMLLLHTKETP